MSNNEIEPVNGLSYAKPGPASMQLIAIIPKVMEELTTQLINNKNEVPRTFLRNRIKSVLEFVVADTEYQQVKKIDADTNEMTIDNQPVLLE